MCWWSSLNWPEIRRSFACDECFLRFISEFHRFQSQKISSLIHTCMFGVEISIGGGNGGRVLERLRCFDLNLQLLLRRHVVVKSSLWFSNFLNFKQIQDVRHFV